MPRIAFEAGESKGWSPLPKGAYDIRIDSVEETLSKQKETPSLMVKGHVEGGQYDQKEVTIFYPIVPGAGFRIKNLLDASGVDYQTFETDKTDKDGKPLTGYDFESDDLIECVIRYDVSVRTYNDKPQNDFQNERSVDGGGNGAAATAPAAGAAAATAPAPAAAPATAAAAVASARADGPQQRRRRV